MTSLVHQHGIGVPKSYLFRGEKQIFKVDGLGEEQSFFVKPNTLGSQIGINFNSHVDNLADARELCHEIKAKYGVESIVQSFVDGIDIRVSCIEKSDYSFGIQCSEVTVMDKSGSQSNFSTNKKISGRIWNFKDVSFTKSIGQTASSIINTLCNLGLIKDYCAVDMRGDETNGFYFLENNVKPFVSETDFLSLAIQENFESAGAMFFTSIVKSYTSQAL
jgi:D-alanine-D-alanine ligase-like ATP-grasp enzyme